LHNGIDFSCHPRTKILAPVSGLITKLGYPYGDDLTYRYVQIEDDEKDNHRVFYVNPTVSVGGFVEEGVTVIGVAQDLTTRYSGITNHVHYEIKRGDEYIQPVMGEAAKNA